MKLRGLAEKWLLKRYAKRWVPADVIARRKYPYRAPAASLLTGPRAPAWARDLLSRDAIAAHGLFDPDKTERLVAKVSARASSPSEADGQAITAIATAQLLADRFVAHAETSHADAGATRVVAA